MLATQRLMDPGRFVRSRWNLTRTIRSLDIHTHRIHVRYISLDLVNFYGELEGRYTSHIFHLGYIKIHIWEQIVFSIKLYSGFQTFLIGFYFPRNSFCKNHVKGYNFEETQIIFAYLRENSKAYLLVGLIVPNSFETTFLQPLFDNPWVILIGIWLHKIPSPMSQTAT